MFHFYPIIKSSLTTRLEALIAPWRRVAEVVILLLWLTLILPNNLSAQGKNVKAGPITMDLTARVSLEYNDNINASGTNGLNDFILFAGMDMAGNWDISRINSMSFNLGAEYRKYFEHPELSSDQNFLILSPDTEMAFTILVKGIEFRFYDKLNFSTDPTDSVLVDPETGEVSYDILSYNRFENRLGIDAEWDLKPLKITFGLNRNDVIPQDIEFEFTDRTQNTIALGGSVQYAANLMVGVEGTYLITEYKDNFQNGSEGYTIGPFVNWQISRFISLAFHSYWNNIDFDNTGDNSDSSDSSTFNFNLSLNHVFNRHYSHSFNLSQTTYLGFIANTTTVENITYSFVLDAIRNVRLLGQFSFEKSEDSGGLEPESSDRFIMETSFRYKFTPSLNGHFSYYLVSKESLIVDRIYDQNRFNFMFSYDF